MINPVSVSPGKGNQKTTRGKEKILLTSVGIEPTTSGLGLPLFCRLSYEVGQRKSGTIKVVNRGEEKVRVHMNVVPHITMNTHDIFWVIGVDIFSSTLQYEVISKNGGQILFRGTQNIQCSEVPQICNLAAGGK